MKTLSEKPLLGWQIEAEITTQLEAMQEQLDKQSELIAKQAALIKYYEGQLRLLKRRQYGTSSERMEQGFSQMTIFGEEEILPPPAEIEEVTVKRKKRLGKRAEDLANLPVERIDHELPENERNCPECTTPMRDIGVKIRSEIDIIPAKAIVREHATHSYACPDIKCQEEQGKQTIVTADAPRPLIAGSLATPSLVAHSYILRRYAYPCGYVFYF